MSEWKSEPESERVRECEMREEEESQRVRESESERVSE